MLCQRIQSNIFIIALVLLLQGVKSTKDYKKMMYQYELNLGDDLCPTPGYECGDPKGLFYLCDKNKTIHEKCECFRQMKFTNHTITMFVNGHNGLRNRVAEKRNISHMNLVYWSKELAAMASGYVRQCKIAKEHPDCLVIGSTYEYVNLNFVFRAHHLFKRWPLMILRDWYQEYNLEPLSEQVKEVEKGRMLNFTQLTWPTTSFFGCGGGRMFNGYLVVCVYYPGYNIAQITELTNFGGACSKCPHQRPTCSKLYPRLCGLDLKKWSSSSNSTKNCVSTYLYFFLFTIYLICQILKRTDVTKFWDK